MHISTQALRAVRLWDRLVSAQVIEEFGHRELEPTSVTQPPKRDVLNALFKDARDERRVADPSATSQDIAATSQKNELFDSIRRVKNEKEFVAFTPETEQLLCAELIFMRTLHEHDWWHKVGDAWVTGLLPKRQLVNFKSDGTYAFVLKTYGVVALCWPAEQVSVNLWRKARTCTSLLWRTIFDTDEVDVVPTEYQSPLHLFMQDCYNVDRSI
jgi:hypothetical protein